MLDIIETYIGELKTIVEAGACDCKDSQKMLEVFPSATVYAFECNPETLPICKGVADKEPRIKLTEAALGEENGFRDFKPIDTKATVTVHADGNPGASSFFTANPEYPSEKYVQKSVPVMTARFDSLDVATYPTPEFLWLDAQGSELAILKGFGDRLKDVKVIKTEVLFKEQYIGAPLFTEVEEWLDAHGFRFVRFLDKYEWFGDAIFVNKSL